MPRLSNGDMSSAIDYHENKQHFISQTALVAPESLVPKPLVNASPAFKPESFQALSCCQAIIILRDCLNDDIRPRQVEILDIPWEPVSEDQGCKAYRIILLE